MRLPGNEVTWEWGCNTVASFPGPHEIHSSAPLLSVLSFRYGTCFQYYDVGISSFPAAVLRGTPYQNNSIVMLEDIGEGHDALLCITKRTACCRSPYTGDMGPALGNWFFPNGTRVPSLGVGWDFYRTRGQMVVRMHHRRGGVEGIYRCEIPDAMNVNQTIYIGVYSYSTGEWSILFWSYCIQIWSESTYIL